jgi:hypothetical protein
MFIHPLLALAPECVRGTANKDDLSSSNGNKVKDDVSSSNHNLILARTRKKKIVLTQVH